MKKIRFVFMQRISIALRTSQSDRCKFDGLPITNFGIQHPQGASHLIIFTTKPFTVKDQFQQQKDDYSL
jgi:hypothetical protein